LQEAGGGGFGDPRQRAIEAVLDDVRNGFVSVNGALEDYGVRVDATKGTATRC